MKLIPLLQNYDIGNHELRTVKLVLEEWRHWLEGVCHFFAVFTDHRNLEYLCEVKNPTQNIPDGLSLSLTLIL